MPKYGNTLIVRLKKSLRVAVILAIILAVILDHGQVKTLISLVTNSSVGSHFSSNGLCL